MAFDGDLARTSIGQRRTRAQVPRGNVQPLRDEGVGDSSNVRQGSTYG